MTTFFTADRIHDGKRWLPENTVIEASADGRIVALHDASMLDKAVRYEGVLVPGFVNVHCHLELSHMKGVIPEHTGLIPFLQQVTFHRNDFTEEQKVAARHGAYEELSANGVVAVGDIANGNDTLDLRSRGQLHTHTFVECIGFTETHAQQRVDYSAQVQAKFAEQQEDDVMLRQTIVPHAPYSVSERLFTLISNHEPASLMCMHNQETEDENLFYQTKEGKVNDLLQSFGIDSSFFAPTGNTSLQSYLPWINAAHPFIFVHNTFTAKEDLEFVKQHRKEAHWCLCPNANLYIENRLPDVALLRQEHASICIGTDSLASNYQLSVLAELQTLKTNFPELEWEELLQWGTLNGATALQMQHELGSIEAGKKPGIVQVIDLESGAPKTKNVFGMKQAAQSAV